LKNFQVDDGFFYFISPTTTLFLTGKCQAQFEIDSAIASGKRKEEIFIFAVYFFSAWRCF